MAAMKSSSITPEDAWFSFVNRLCNVIVHTIQIEVRTCTPMISHLIETLESRVFLEEERNEINSSDVNTQKVLLRKRLKEFALAVRESIEYSVGDTDRVVNWILHDAPTSELNVLFTMVRCLMSRVAPDHHNRHSRNITSSKTWRDNIDMWTRFWQVEIGRLRCLPVPIIMTNDIDIKDENIKKRQSKFHRSGSMQVMSRKTLLRSSFTLGGTNAENEEVDYSSDDDEGYDNEDEEDEEEKNMQFRTDDKKSAKHIKMKALRYLRRMVIPVAKMHGDTICAKCKKKLHHEVAFNVSEHQQKTHKYKGVPSFAFELRTMPQNLEQKELQLSALKQNGYDDNGDVAALNHETERRREERIENRRRAIENNPTIRINKLVLLNDMAYSMFNALNTNGCVKTVSLCVCVYLCALDSYFLTILQVQGMRRSILMTDVLDWFCDVEIEMFVSLFFLFCSLFTHVTFSFHAHVYLKFISTHVLTNTHIILRYSTVKLSSDETQTYVVLNITKDGMYALKPDEQKSSIQLDNVEVQIKGTDIGGHLQPDLVDLCGRVRVLMNGGNLRAFYPEQLKFPSSSSKYVSEHSSSSDDDDDDEDDNDGDSTIANTTIYVRRHEIQTILARPRFPSDVLCSICRCVPSSTFRPYSTRSKEISQNIEEWIKSELSEKQASKYSENGGSSMKATIRRALIVAARAEKEMLRTFNTCERCESEAEAHVTNVDYSEDTFSSFRTRIGIPGFTQHISKYLRSQRHVIRSKTSKRVLETPSTQYTSGFPSCYPFWLRTHFGRLESELKLVRDFIQNKIEHLEKLKYGQNICEVEFKNKVNEMESYCAWYFPCERRLQEDSSAHTKWRAKAKLNLSSSDMKKNVVKDGDDEMSEAKKRIHIEYEEDYMEYLIHRRKLFTKGWVRIVFFNSLTELLTHSLAPFFFPFNSISRPISSQYNLLSIRTHSQPRYDSAMKAQ